ncbi:MAG: hypothetical protein FWG77_04040 [Treponema sp.]|nr:hypothetical protein [Treponema sp.]
MAYTADLYSILVGYVDKNNSPYIEVNTILDYLAKSARPLSLSNPDWKKWEDQVEREENFWSELSALIENGRCERITSGGNIFIYMPHYCIRLLEKIYTDPDEDASSPFPSENSLGFVVPENQAVFLNSDKDLIGMLDDAIQADIPIIKIAFSEGFGSALVLSKMLPRRMAEVALLKIREYLRRSGNKEYALRKLALLLKCNENYLQDLLEQIVAKPIDAFSEIERGRDLASHFWAHFSYLVKNDIRKKAEILSMDIAAFQAFSIISAISGYYKARAVKLVEAENALKEVEANLAKPPYFYTMDQIIKFTGPKGETLLGQFSTDQLENWIKSKATESKNGELPELFILPGTAKNARSFVLKEKMLPLVLRLLVEAQVQVKNAIFKRWSTLLLEFEREPAMESEKEFEKFLPKITEKQCPMLMSILMDPRIILIAEEQERKSVAISAKLFNKGQLLPYSVLLLLRRRDLLYDAKRTLPFWYTIPLIANIIFFFKGIFGQGKPGGSGRDGSDDSRISAGKNLPEDIKAAAKELSYSLTPVGNTHDQYMRELQDRWCLLLDKQARDHLVEDVHALARDNVRHAIKVNKHFRPSYDSVRQIAWNVVSLNTTLSTLSTKDALLLYLELYILDLLGNVRQ